MLWCETAAVKMPFGLKEQYVAILSCMRSRKAPFPDFECDEANLALDIFLWGFSQRRNKTVIHKPFSNLDGVWSLLKYVTVCKIFSTWMLYSRIVKKVLCFLLTVYTFITVFRFVVVPVHVSQAQLHKTNTCPFSFSDSHFYSPVWNTWDQS